MSKSHRQRFRAALREQLEEIEIKACPMCGRLPTILTTNDSFGLECADCLIVATGTTLDGAREQWNRRTPLMSPEELIRLIYRIGEQYQDGVPLRQWKNVSSKFYEIGA